MTNHDMCESDTDTDDTTHDDDDEIAIHHTELGTCRTSLVFSDQPELCCVGVFAYLAGEWLTKSVPQTLVAHTNYKGAWCLAWERGCCQWHCRMCHREVLTLQALIET